MTQRDKWQKRPIVVKYREFCDTVRALKINVPESDSHVIFTIQMPKSWSKKNRKMMNGRPHQQVPDADNLLKALLDAIYGDDKGVWDVRVTKVWGYEPQIRIQ